MSYIAEEKIWIKSSLLETGLSVEDEMAGEESKLKAVNNVEQ